MKKRVKDYDEYGQATPKNKPLYELGIGEIRTRGVRYVKREEFEKLQEELAKSLNDMTTLLEQLLDKMRQATLHLAAISEEDVSSEDAEE